jgi:predicted metal-binding membrane protein
MTPQSFLVTWIVMTAAMMAPSALPFIVAFARRVREWPLPTVVLAGAYLGVWALFGVGAYFVSMAFPMSWPAGIAILFVGLYAFTPLMRAGQARCIAMCRRKDPVEGRGFRAALGEGLTYGVSCVACSGGVMLALVVLGMSSVVLMAAGSALILVYKIAGGWPRRFEAGLSIAFVIAGLWLVA